MKRILVIIFFNLLLISCVNLSKDKKYNNYIEYFESQKESITSHFPLNYKSILNDYRYSVDTAAYFNTQTFNIMITGTKKEIEELNRHKFYNIDDECIIIVNDFMKIDNIPFIPSEGTATLWEDQDKEYKTTYSTKCIDTYKVIPNFWSYEEDKTTKNGLNKDFKYIILDMDMGNNVYSRKLNPNISYMPNFAKHGYSKGIAFNEKENIIIYWLIFW